jgi:hypothetical protein
MHNHLTTLLEPSFLHLTVSKQNHVTLSLFSLPTVCNNVPFHSVVLLTVTQNVNSPTLVNSLNHYYIALTKMVASVFFF